MIKRGSLVVLGSLHYDIMLEATHRPEKGETVTGNRWYPKFGGKGGNQAVAAAQNGADVRFVSATGSDNFADFLHEQLEQAGVSSEFVTRVSSVGSGMSVAIQDSEGDYGAVIVSGANLSIEPETLLRRSLWSGASLLLLQNEVPEDLNIKAATKAKEINIPVCLNAAPMREMRDELTQLIDILVVNSVEAEALGAAKVNSLEAATDAAQCLASRYATVVVTAGSDGVAVCSANGESISLAAKNITVVSTHGAGDVFAGSLCAELTAGKSLRESVELSNTRAAVHVAS